MTRMDTVEARRVEAFDDVEHRVAPRNDHDDSTQAPIPAGGSTVAKAPPGIPVAPVADSPLKKPADMKRGPGGWRERLPTLHTTLMAGGVLIVLIVGMWRGWTSIAPLVASAAVAVAAHLWLPGVWYILLGGVAGALAGAFSGSQKS